MTATDPERLRQSAEQKHPPGGSGTRLVPEPSPPHRAAVSVVLQVEGIVKRYGALTALDGVSFVVREGSCFGVLGPNGAGKTTLVEILEGMRSPDCGNAYWRGRPLDRGFREAAGIQFQATALQERLTVAEHLALFRRLYRKSLPVAELARLCALDELLERDAARLSGGQRQRLLLAIALVNDPDVLFLDEPTTGLDPQARRNFWDLIERIRARGKTLLLTTHYMDEAQRLCDEIAILDHGRIIAQGSPQELLERHFNEVVVELPREDLPAHTAADLRMRILEAGNRVEIPTTDVNQLVRQLLDAGVPLARLRVRPPSLEDLFLELTGRELRR